MIGALASLIKTAMPPIPSIPDLSSASSVEGLASVLAPYLADLQTYVAALPTGQ